MAGAGPPNPVVEINARLGELTAAFSANATATAEQVAGLRDMLTQFGRGLANLEQRLAAAIPVAGAPAGPSDPPASSEPSGSIKLPSSLKVGQAPKYGGERTEDVDSWIFLLEELFELTSVTLDELRIRFAGQCLVKHAATWYRACRMATAAVASASARVRFTTWVEFKSAIKAQFQPTDKVAEAKEELLRLDQGKGTVRDFTERFLHLATVVPDMRDQDLLAIYMAGLKGKTKLEIKVKNPSSLADALEMAERYENALHQAGMKKGSLEDDAVAPFAGSDPMDLTAIGTPAPQKRSNGISPAERERRRRENLCFKCGSADHQARECKSPYPGNGPRPAPKGRDKA